MCQNIITLQDFSKEDEWVRSTLGRFPFMDIELSDIAAKQRAFYGSFDYSLATLD